MKYLAAIASVLVLVVGRGASANDRVVYAGKEGPGRGKQIVFLAGDEEYRSEEGMPMLARILAVHHGFKCTVLFSIDPKTGGWKATPLDYNNRHQYTLSLGGPIIKNRTFFFGLWDGLINSRRTVQNVTVLTPCAQKPAPSCPPRSGGKGAWWDTRGYLPAPAASANRERAAEPPRPGQPKRPPDALRQYPS